jgi:hypothetical protein
LFIGSNTNTQKGWGYEAKLPTGLAFEGVILNDQVKNLDWTARSLDIRGHVTQDIIDECLAKVSATYHDPSALYLDKRIRFKDEHRLGLNFFNYFSG